MQTLSIDDSYIQEFMKFVKDSHSNITIPNERKLEHFLKLNII